MSRTTESSSCEGYYESVLAPYMVKFLDMKMSTGRKIKNMKYTLKSFDRFFATHGLSSPMVRQADYESWTGTLSERKASTVYESVSVIGQFLRFMLRHGIPCYQPVYPRKPKNRYTPYIFSKEELSRLFSCADSLLLQTTSYTSIIFSIPVLLRVLYSTGMRIGEACRLNNEDLDTDRKIITLRDTKNKVERLIPISNSLYSALCEYISKRDRLPVIGISQPTSPLLTALNGKRVHPGTVGFWFHKILKNAGIPYAPHHGPRIHDLRFTFAVHALETLTRSGRDTYNALPILSVAMGHKCVSDTEYYVKLTNLVYPDLNEMSSDIAEYVFPTIIEKDKK